MRYNKSVRKPTQTERGKTIMEKLDGKWYIRVANYLNDYMQAGTSYKFTDETNDDILDRM